MKDTYPRDWQGYGQQRPRFQWPLGNRLAISLVLNYEEGAERNPLDGDDCSENLMSGFSTLPSLSQARHFSSESLYSYGSRVGCWRLLRLFERCKVPATIFACGLALERNPEFAGYLQDSSHEIAGHGYRWIDYSKVDAVLEREHIHRTLDIIESCTGKKVTGWYTGRKSSNTRELVIDAGLTYDSDDYSDDLPWWLNTGSKHHLIIPYTLLNNDCQYTLSPGWSTPEQAWQHLKATFDTLYHESEEHPTLMSIGIHCRLSGHPGRSQVLKKFIEYAQAHNHVWFTTRASIADYWQENCPPAPMKKEGNNDNSSL